MNGRNCDGTMVKCWVAAALMRADGAAYAVNDAERDCCDAAVVDAAAAGAAVRTTGNDWGVGGIDAVANFANVVSVASDVGVVDAADAAVAVD